MAGHAAKGHHWAMLRTLTGPTDLAGLRVDAADGRLLGARQAQSPNCDDRPAATPPQLVVVHGISLPPGEFGGPWIDALFMNQLEPDAHPYFAGIANLRVSAHLVVHRDGSVVQYVPFHRRAWHAGASQWRGRERCNDFSIGIELEGSDATAYAPAQYAVLARVVAEPVARRGRGGRPQRRGAGPQVRPGHRLRLAAAALDGPLPTRGAPRMSLLALLLALVFERGLTHLFHLREPRWLDRYFDWVARRLGGGSGGSSVPAAVLALALPVLPVALLDRMLGGHLLGLLQLAFAVLVLLLSFGPRDLREEVDDYVAALERGDREEADRRAKELLESDAAGRGAGLRQAVEEAIFVQANNRVFGVILWFMVLGPAGAWLFRVSDLMRRRAAFEGARSGDAARGIGAAFAILHGLLAWIPARLAAASYALAGSFEDAVGNWRVAVDSAAENVLDRSEDLLARVGMASLQPSLAGLPPETLDAASARGAWRIVSRATWIWLSVVALLVLAGSVA